MRSSAILRGRPSWRRLVVVGAAAVGAGALAHAHTNSARQDARRQPVSQLRLSRPVVDGMAGAIGEVLQVALLYPLETIKVRCQADGLSAGQVVQSMVAKHGLSMLLLRQLYAGFSAAAAFSCVVGAVHWLSFCSAKRMALATLPLAAPTPSRSTAPTDALVGPLLGAASVPEQHLLAVMLPPVECGGMGKRGEGEQPQPVQQMAALASVVAGGAVTLDTPEGHLQRQRQREQQRRAKCERQAVAADGAAQQQDGAADGAGDLAKRTSANMIGAMVGALCTALVEAPVELFRHQAQAGLISGNLVAEMGRAMRSGGPLALWQGFLPFCIEAFPYDAVELGCFSQLRDGYEATLSRSAAGSRLGELLRAVPEHACDAAMGAAAGAAAVLLSMPLDAIKTYIQTHHSVGAQAVGVSGQLGLFLKTGICMVRRRGVGALYAGMAPRLAQQVPSSTLCFVAVQQTQKLLEPFIDDDGGVSAHAAGDHQ